MSKKRIVKHRNSHLIIFLDSLIAVTWLYRKTNRQLKLSTPKLSILFHFIEFPSTQKDIFLICLKGLEILREFYTNRSASDNI
jgi:hypothetical protein